MGEPPGNSSGVPEPRRFRRLWRGLDPLRRERLTQVVARGDAAQNPSDASLAVGLARREKRHSAVLFFVVPPLTIVVMLGFATLVNRSSNPAARVPLSWSVVFLLSFLLFFEAAILVRWIRVRRAEIVNTRVAAGKSAPDEPLAWPLRRLEQALVRLEQAFESETRRRGQWHCPRCGRPIPQEKAPPTTAIGGHWLQPPDEELMAACEQDHQIRPRRR